MPLDPLVIIVRGKHDTGKTTVANLIRMFLEENGFGDVKVKDTLPIPADAKPAFFERFERNRGRPIRITVELEEAPERTPAQPPGRDHACAPNMDDNCVTCGVYCGPRL